MYFLTYMSRACAHISEEELQGILENARLKNAEADVTGLLLLRSGTFFQLLEGKRHDVLATFARIARDPRHRQIDVLFEFEEEGAKRFFPHWQMGNVDDARASTGQAGLLRSLHGIAASGKPSRVKLLELLRAFSAAAPNSAAEILRQVNRSPRGAEL